MNKLEEQLWNYIDGSCSAVERAEIEVKLVSDDAFKLLYEELLAINQQLNGQIDLEEPSMSFTRNVMEQVDLELAPVSLKTKVDHKIIYAIGGFFVLSLLTIFGYAIATAKPDFNIDMPDLNWQMDFHGLFNSTALRIFVFVDLVLLLIYFDTFLRKGLNKVQKK